MAYVNRVILLGNLVRDPELRTTNSGTSVCNLTLAMNKKIKGVDKAIFVEVTAWSGTAEAVVKYCGKGDTVLVEGELDNQEWEDRETGKKRSKIFVQCSNCQFIRTKGHKDRGSDKDEPPAKRVKEIEDGDDKNKSDIPF